MKPGALNKCSDLPYGWGKFRKTSAKRPSEDYAISHRFKCSPFHRMRMRQEEEEEQKEGRIQSLVIMLISCERGLFKLYLMLQRSWSGELKLSPDLFPYMSDLRISGRLQYYQVSWWTCTQFLDVGESVERLNQVAISEKLTSEM